MLHNIKYQTRLVDLTEIMKSEVNETIEYNVNHKMTSYWNKHLHHPDSEALIKTDIRKDAKWDTYTGKIEIKIPWQAPLIHESTYHNVIDFINNSFKHFKEQLA